MHCIFKRAFRAFILSVKQLKLNGIPKGTKTEAAASPNGIVVVVVYMLLLCYFFFCWALVWHHALRTFECEWHKRTEKKTVNKNKEENLKQILFFWPFFCWLKIEFQYQQINSFFILTLEWGRISREFPSNSHFSNINFWNL